MGNHKNIIDKLIKKYFNNEKIFFDERFDEYIKNYDIEKNDFNSNADVLLLLTDKVNQEFQYIFDNLLSIALESQTDFITKESYKKIVNMIDFNIQVRWSVYKDHHEQFKLINMIKKKYGYDIQKKIIRNDIKNPNDVNDTQTNVLGKKLTKEELKGRISYGKNGSVIVDFS